MNLCTARYGLAKSILISGLLATMSPLLAQQLTISGTVSDTGGVVPGVNIAMTSPTGSTQTAVTDAMGQYKFDGLKSGPYELTFDKQGYQKIIRDVVLAGNSTTIDEIIGPAVVTTSVDVTDLAQSASENGTASLMPIPDKDVPAMVSVVTQRMIQEQSLNSVADALQNISGATVSLQYGAYEWYTLDGFTQQSGTDFLFIDGMLLTGNRPITQINNVEEIQVYKGADAVLYGGAGAGMGGMVNVIRKKPQATRTTDVMFRTGRWDQEDAQIGTAGKVFDLDRLLYRVDGAYSYCECWRGAGSKRANVSPDLLWLINDRMRISFNESFSQDHYDMDDGVPLAVLDLPGFPLDRRFTPPDNFEKFHSWENTIVYNVNLTNRLTYRNMFFHARNNDQYLDADTLSYVPGSTPATSYVDRTDLYYFHHRRPMQDRNDLIGTYDFWKMRHHILMGYDYEDRYYYTYRTNASMTEAPVSLEDFLSPGYVDPSTGITQFPLSAIDYYTQQVNAEYFQDQINIGRRLRLNLAGRYEQWQYVEGIANYNDGIFLNRQPDSPNLRQHKYTYRYGAVYYLFGGLDLYANVASNFQPVTTQPTTGTLLYLVPSTSYSWEAGPRWTALHHRLTVDAAFRRIIEYNIPIPLGGGAYDQAGKADGNNVDVDVDGDLGHGFHLLTVYGWTLPRYDQYVSSRGVNEAGWEMPDAPRDSGRVWLTKTFSINEKTSLFSSAGLRYISGQYLGTNSDYVGGFTIFSGAVGLRREKWEFQLNANNLLDRQRYFASSIGSQLYPGPPIDVIATIRYKFQ